jgi:hypothetical protein
MHQNSSRMLATNVSDLVLRLRGSIPRVYGVHPTIQYSSTKVSGLPKALCYEVPEEIELLFITNGPKPQ